MNFNVKRFVNSFFNSNSYILHHPDAKECWLIDCGDAEPIIEWLNEDGKILAGIFITHTHFDHIYGLNQILSNFSDCVIYTSQYGKEGLYSDKLNLSAYHQESFVLQSDSLQILKNADKIQLWENIAINTLTTPGHDRSCLSYLVEECFFTGDSYIPGQKVITTFPKSNKEQANESIQKIINLFLDNTIVFPGHGEYKKMGALRRF